MNIKDVINLIEATIEEDANYKEALWNKEKYSTKDMVEKGKGESISRRKINPEVSSETRAKKYINRMDKGKVNSEGKQHEYTGGGIRQGLQKSHSGMDLSDAQKKKEVFAKKLALRKKGDFKDHQVLKAYKSGTLTEREYKALMNTPCPDK